MTEQKVKDDIYYLYHKITVLDATIFDLKLRIIELEKQNETKNDD